MKRIFFIVSMMVLSAGLLSAQESGDAFIEVSPTNMETVSAHVGETATFTTIHIHQGNLNGPTHLYLSGYNADQFHLSATEVSADQSDLDLVITYEPTRTGSHMALLNIDNYSHTALFQSVTLRGICEDVSLHPTLTITPAELPEFEAKATEEITQSFSVTSSECNDFVYLHVEHIEGAAFTINTSMLAKNTTSEVEVRFAPTEEGTYESVVTISTLGAEDVTLTLRGKATPADPEMTTWQHEFIWEALEPLTMLNETFDSIHHNKPLKVKGWQNVAPEDQRPWWGYDQSIVPQWHTDGKFAKATSYQYGSTSTGTWEMWLVTPPLDYKNTEKKVFAFSVMGEYLSEYGSEDTFLEIYYMQPDNGNVLVQDLTDFFEFPRTSEEDREWIMYVLDLTPYAETMADVFYMGFRYYGPNGNEGAVTYYIDDVSWGVMEPTATEHVTADGTRSVKRLENGHVVIVRGEAVYNVLGVRVR